MIYGQNDIFGIGAALDDWLCEDDGYSYEEADDEEDL